MNRLLAGSCALCVLSAAHSADRVYYFVDERGVAHFSNVPADSRYKPLPGTGTLAPPEPRGAPAPVPVPMPGPASSIDPLPWPGAGLAAPVTGEPLPEEIVPEEIVPEDVEIPIEPDDR